jgi:hypothetical protein
MADVNFRIGLYEAKVIVPVQEFAPGTYTFQFGMPAGNSILSTIFVQDLDGGASVKVNYHDSGPGDGTQPGERVELEGHPLIDAGTPRSDRRIISRLANKPKAEVIVTGGSVTLGIHIAVVADFPQELALTDGQTAELEADKGSPLMVYDEADNKWFALRGDNGVPEVSGFLKPSGLTIEGKTTTVSINDVTWTALPLTPLSSRNSISIQNFSGMPIVLNFNPLTVGFNGYLLPNGAERYYDISDQIIIYAKSSPGISSATITTEELA